MIGQSSLSSQRRKLSPLFVEAFSIINVKED